jgi:NodT family efflux transporter outer membrane factor (OMF) lipoprotein
MAYDDEFPDILASLVGNSSYGEHSAGGSRRALVGFFMNFSCSLLISGLALYGLSSCGMDSATQRTQVSLPANWKSAGKFPVASPRQDLSRWWSRFDDPTLNRIISEALANSPDMASASARIRESQARRNAEAATRLPFIQGTASGSSNSNLSELSDSDSNFGAGVNVSWEADLFGKRRSRIEAATAQIGASEENFHSVQAALAAEIGIIYTQLRVNEAALEVLYRTIKTREETSQLASWRTQSGEADALESSQALSSLEQARAGVPGLLQAIEQARNQLALLAGQVPGSMDGRLASGKKTIPDPARSLTIGIPADTIRQRPDVRLAGYQLLAAAANVRAADAERYPALNITGTISSSTISSGNLFSPETAATGLVAGLSGPIFNAGRIRSNIEAENAAEEQAFQTYRSTVLTALSEVENSLIACRRTTERLATLEKATAAAREAASLAQQSYQAGETDILTVLDAQRSILGLESNLFNARADRTNSFIQLYRALGGGWSVGS